VTASTSGPGPPSLCTGISEASDLENTRFKKFPARRHEWGVGI
jgi:hypothetical protein